MEKRKIYTSHKISLINLLLIVIFMFSLISCGSHAKSKTKESNMSENTNSQTELFKHVVELNAQKIGNSEQIILVTNDSIHSKNVMIYTFEKKDNKWIMKFAGIKGSIGRNGFSPFQQKREGDNTTPTGIFGLGPVFGYADQVKTKMEYRQATEHDFWIDDTLSDDYNKWVTLDTAPSVSHENMRRKDNLYKLGIVVQYNTRHIEKGLGSAIFIHIQREPGYPTAGCVAMPENKLDSIIQWLQAVKKPLIIMGTEMELERITM